MGMSVERLAAIASIAAALVTIAAFCGFTIAGNIASRARSSPDPALPSELPTSAASSAASPAAPTPVVSPPAAITAPGPQGSPIAAPAAPVSAVSPTAAPAALVPVAAPTAAPAASAPRLFIIVKAKSYHVQVQSSDGSYINLELHKGTVINPVGAVLAPGMHIAVRGTQQPDGSISTDQVDVESPP